MLSGLRAGLALGDRPTDQPTDRLEVAQKTSERRPPVSQVVKQPVVHRPPPEHPPEPLDHVLVGARRLRAACSVSNGRWRTRKP